VVVNFKVEQVFVSRLYYAWKQNNGFQRCGNKSAQRQNHNIPLCTCNDGYYDYEIIWESHYCRDDKIIFYLKQTFKNIAKPDKINPREIILVNWTANSIVSLSKPYANNLTVCSVKTNIKRTITEEITNIMFMTLLVKAFAAFSPFCANMLLYME